MKTFKQEAKDQLEQVKEDAKGAVSQAQFGKQGTMEKFKDSVQTKTGKLREDMENDVKEIKEVRNQLEDSDDTYGSDKESKTEKSGEKKDGVKPQKLIDWSNIIDTASNANENEVNAMPNLIDNLFEQLP